MKAIKERAKSHAGVSTNPCAIYNEDYVLATRYASYKEGATEQRAIDIKVIPQLYVRWLMIDGDKPSWEEYANKTIEE